MQKQKIQTNLLGGIISSNSQEAFQLYEKSRFGEKIGEKIQYTYSEAIYLTEEQKADIYFGKKLLSKDELIKKLKKRDKKIEIKYPVFRDLRKKGYVVKTALKFGADFRVYKKGIKPGQDHAKWIVFADYETKTLNWQEFSSKNRIAHSTKKKLLLAIVDEESDVTYYEVNWIKP